jgi:hypothetical protein
MLSKPIDSIGFVSQFDPEVAQMMDREFSRQKDGLELIASENFASPAVIAAMGSVLTNKYAEGLPGHRYYGGCHFVDELETLCIERAKALIPILVPLFISAFRRADELATAMECRCYQGGEGRTKMKLLRYHREDFIAFGLGAGLIFVVVMLANLGL